MNNYNFEIGFVTVVISVILRVTAAFMFGFVSYKAYKETGIKNGLIGLRRQLFASSSVLLLLNTLALGLLISRPLVSREGFILITNGLSIVNSMGLFFVAYLFLRIYTQSYSTSSKAHHVRISVMEKSFKKTQIRNSKKRKAMR